MREIKYRAWDKILQGYTKNSMGLFHNEGIITFDVGTRYIFEQYTGLKDKNGVKGYFGEIAKHDDGCFGVVKWDDRALRVYFDWDDKKRTYPNPYSDYIDFVFVGNIHQNPELLENK